MTACLLLSHVTTFFSDYVEADPLTSALEIAPIVEELMKFAPILFYLLAAAPEKEKIPENVLTVSIGFATFENVCYLTANGSDDIADLVLRGFGTGAMHVVGGMIIAVGLVLLAEYTWLRVVGTVGLLTVSITYHGVFNIFVAQTGVARIVGFAIPLFITLVVVVTRKIISRLDLQK